MNDKVERLKELLKGRREEYEIFGCTSADIEQDQKILNQITDLEK